MWSDATPRPPFVIPVRVGSLETICSRGTPVKHGKIVVSRGLPESNYKGQHTAVGAPSTVATCAARAADIRKSAGAIETDQPIEPVNLGQPLMAHATLMVIEGVNNDVFGAAVRVICGVDDRDTSTSSRLRTASTARSASAKTRR